MTVIDVWNALTFDAELVEHLEENADLICSYYQEENQIFLSHDHNRGKRLSILRPTNRYAYDFNEMLDMFEPLMDMRIIRAFHYTRLTEEEVVNFQKSGIHVSTPETLWQRLGAVVTSGKLDRDIADRLFAESPFKDRVQLDARSGKFCLASHPEAVDYSGVVPLLECWGGEVASMWVRDLPISAPLLHLGQPRVIEVAVPLNVTTQSYRAGQAVVATYGRARGALPEIVDFDLYVQTALPPTAVIAIHTKGDPAFEAMGREYPQGFIDFRIGRWKELTGED